MKPFPIEFDPKPGLNSDDTTFAAQGRWADGSNVRFRLGRPQVVGGYTAAITSTALTGICRSIHGWLSTTSIYRTAFGTTTKIQFASNLATTLFDITPVGFVGGTGTIWSFANYGDDLIACPFAGTIYQWAGNTGIPAAALSNAPASVRGGILTTPERQVLAFGATQEDGTWNGLCIRGSDIEDTNDWTTTSSNNAFEHILDGEGRIVAARLIAGYVAVWTSTALYLGQFLGQPGQTYRFDKVAGGVGCAGLQAVTTTGGVAYWVAPNHTLWRWAPGGVPEQIPCPIQKDFQDNVYRGASYLLGQSRIVVSTVRQMGEVWFFYPRGTSTECTHYLALSLNEGTWFRGDIARTAWLDTDLTERALDSSGAQPKTSYLLGVSEAGAIYFHEVGNTANGSALNWYLQSADQYLESGRRRVMIRGIEPDLKDQVGDVSLTLYMRDRPQSTPVTKGPYTLTVNAGKKDFRASGMIAAVKLSGGATTGSYMRLGKPVFDVALEGAR